jgi:HlyD family type I secretion membrane fusion protein
MAGYALILATFFVMGGWAAYARIDSAVIATGTVTVETNRKTVQHFEGGVAREILVREGLSVREGQVLFRLDPTQARASADIVRSQLDNAIATHARLLSEQRQHEAIEFPAELLARRAEPQVARILEENDRQFVERRASMRGQIGLLDARATLLRQEIEGLTSERTATMRQLEKIAQELEGMHKLQRQGLIQFSRVYALEREQSRIEGLIGRNLSDVAKVEKAIGESRLQAAQLRQRLAEDVATQIAETGQRIAEARERLRVAEDVFERLDILAPIAGVVQNQRVFTQGAVIRPGEALLDIVPDNANLIIHAQVNPLDSSHVRSGLIAEIRLKSFPARQMPILLGSVSHVSRDRLVDEATRQPYFLAQVAVDMKTVPDEFRHRITAGMPAEIVMPTGERTALDYLISPLKDRFRMAMREQ